MKKYKIPKSKEIIVTCDCMELNHLMRITKYEDEPQAYVTMVMNHYLPFWKRVRIAFKYIFKKSPCAGYDELILNRKWARELKKFLEII